MSFMNIVHTANSLNYMKRWSDRAKKNVKQKQANPDVVGIWGAIGLGIMTSPLWGGALWAFYKLAFDYNMPITAFIIAMIGLGIVAHLFTMIDADETSNAHVEPNDVSSDELYNDGWKSEDFK